MTPSPHPQPASGDRIAHSQPPKDRTQEAQPFVSQSGQGLSALSDTEREDHIKDCAWLMEDAMRRWYETSDIGYRGEAARWRILMEEAIKGRSPEFAKKLEKERGLA